MAATILELLELAQPDRWLSHLRDRLATPWLWGLDGAQWLAMAEARASCLVALRRSGDRPLLLSLESEPVPLLASVVAAMAQDCSIVLGNPNWSPAEKRRVCDWLRPDRVWGDRSLDLAGLDRGIDRPPWPTDGPWIGLPTGGTSGQIRFALHSPASLAASVAGFGDYFAANWPGDRPYSTLCSLPLYHASGLMQVLRCFWGQGRLAIGPLAAGRSIGGTSFLSLVPTQLARLIDQDINQDIDQDIDWLRSIQTILLGGAPAWPALLDRAQQLGLRLAPTYGSTETASQVATLRPEAFLAGARGVGSVLPHAQIAIAASTTGDAGLVTIRGRSLAAGYATEAGIVPLPTDASGAFCTDDLGYFDAADRLHIVGRASHKIITGGENVFPAEVEAALWATGLVRDVAVLGLPDPEWGQAVAAACVPHPASTGPDRLRSALADRLSRYKIPKRWLLLDRLPRNAQGKVDRTQLAAQFATRA
jgi:O-succinylbenzoic acid--CoA ligase